MTPKRPRDPNQLAKRVIDIATGSVQDQCKIDPGRKRAQRTPSYFA
jgi:hypothetical protein